MRLNSLAHSIGKWLRGDTRYALLAIAQVAAKIATSHAREMLNRYTAIRIAIDGTSVARLEPGARAEEAYTHGLVLRAEGRLTASAERLQVAFETWASIGFEWRSARAALELAELGAGDRFRLPYVATSSKDRNRFSPPERASPSSGSTSRGQVASRRRTPQKLRNESPRLSA